MMTGPSEHSQQPRSLPLGLQLLVAVGIVFLVALVVRQTTIVPARGEMNAAGALEKLGCEIEWCNPPDEIETPLGTYRRSWFAEILGEKYFSSIGQVRIRRGVKEDLAQHLTRLRGYKEAVALLRGTDTTDAGVKGIAGTPKLRIVDLSATPVGDAGVKELAAAGDLEVLDLEHTRVTDDAVASLAAMPRLQEVNLEGTQVSDRAVERLKKAKPELKVQWATAPSEASRAAVVKVATIPGLAIRATRTASKERVYAAAVAWGYFSVYRAGSFSDINAISLDLAQEGLSSLWKNILNALAPVPELARLKLYGDVNWLIAQDIEALTKFQALRDLYIENGYFLDNLRGLARLTNLRRLTLRECTSPGQSGGIQAKAMTEFWEKTQESLRRKTGRPKGAPGPAPPPKRSKNIQWDSEDDWLAFVAGLPNLEVLDLSGTPVTFAALMRLRGTPRLRELVISAIPPGGDKAELQRALPKVKIRIASGDNDKEKSETLFRAIHQQQPADVQKWLAESLNDRDPIP